MTSREVDGDHPSERVTEDDRLADLERREKRATSSAQVSSRQCVESSR